jgi:hypothetical protein
MVKLTKMPADTAAGLTVRERMLLFCAASGTDWQHAGIPGETVTAMMVKGFVSRDAAGEVALTDRGRAVAACDAGGPMKLSPEQHRALTMLAGSGPRAAPPNLSWRRGANGALRLWHPSRNFNKIGRSVAPLRAFLA